MKLILPLVGVSLLLLAGASLIANTGCADPKATPLTLKLRQAWMTEVEAQRIPNRIPCKKITDLLPDLKWSQISISLFEATVSNQKKNALLQVVYAQNAASEQYHTHVFYSQAGKLSVKEFNQDEEGWLYLLENREVSVAVLKPRPAANDYESMMQKAGRVVIPKTEPQSALLNLVVKETLPENTLPRYFGLEHSAERAMVLHNVATGDKVTDFPATPSDWDEMAGRELDQVSIGNDFIFAGTEYKPKTGNNFVWLDRRENRNLSWQESRVRYDSSYLKGLLPKFLQSFKMRTNDFSLRPQVDKNANIIFRFVGELANNEEKMVCQGLILQPRQGSPKLLTWAVYHSSLLDARASAANEKKQRDAARTFNHVWYPNENGKVISEYQKTNPDNDFFFDVDTANNAVIYLLGGRLWAIDLPDTSTPAQPEAKP